MSDTRTDTQPADDEGKAPKIEGDFDEERAKRLVANLRAEVDELKERNAAITAERDEFKTAAEKTGADRDDALKKALERAEAAERTLAINKHNLPDDVVEEFSDYLTGSAEEVEAKAAKLAKRLGLTADEKGDEPSDDEAGDAGDEQPDEQEEPPAPSRRPRTDYRPGHGGENEPVVDEAEIARRARQRAY